MPATCSSVAIIKHDLCFFMSETPTKDEIYTSMIYGVLEYEIILGLTTYMEMLITRIIGGSLQIMEIDYYIFVAGVRRRDQKHVSFDM
jgi:hypothetical protein